MLMGRDWAGRHSVDDACAAMPGLIPDPFS